MPAAFVEAAETFRNLASAAALEHDIVLQSCEDWEDEGKWSRAFACFALCGDPAAFAREVMLVCLVRR